jgi:hypothetical protein
MPTDYLTFTCTAPTHKAGNDTVQLTSFTEPADDWTTIYEIVPGHGVDAKDLGLGAEVLYTFGVIITSATYPLQVATLAAWRLFKDGYGSIEYASADYGPITVASVRLKGCDLTSINPLYAEATLTFQKVLNNA